MQKQTSITAFAIATPRYARVARPFSSPLVPRKRPKRGPGRPPKKQRVDVLDSQYHAVVVEGLPKFAYAEDRDDRA